MSARQALTSFTYAFLKLGAIAYLFPIFWDNIRNPDVTGDIVITRLLIWGISYLIVSFIIIVTSRENFSMFGFGIVLAAALFNIFQGILSNGLSTGLAIHFFVLTICFYFITKEYRSHRNTTSVF